ncbi:MAG: T9SS type A sorting domain-containing protein [Candidatus Anstonellaceae archaeon]
MRMTAKATLAGIAIAALISFPSSKLNSQINENQIKKKLADKVLVENSSAYTTERYKIYKEGVNFVLFPPDVKVEKIELKERKDENKITAPDNTTGGMRIIYGDAFCQAFVQKIIEDSLTGGGIGWISKIYPLDSFPSHRNGINIFPQGRIIKKTYPRILMPPNTEGHYIATRTYYMENIWPPYHDSVNAYYQQIALNLIFQHGDRPSVFFFAGDSDTTKKATKMIIISITQFDSNGVQIVPPDPRVRSPPVAAAEVVRDDHINGMGDFREIIMAMGTLTDMQILADGKILEEHEFQMFGGMNQDTLNSFFVRPPIRAKEFVIGVEEKFELVKEYRLSQNYPNPFNSQTTIEFSLLRPGRVVIRVYDMIGRRIAEIVNEELKDGTYRVSWKPQASISSGTYIYELSSDGYIDRRKMIYIK